MPLSCTPECHNTSPDLSLQATATVLPVSPSALRAELVRAACKVQCLEELFTVFADLVRRALRDVGCGVWTRNGSVRSYDRVAESCCPSLCGSVERSDEVHDVIVRASTRRLAFIEPGGHASVDPLLLSSPADGDGSTLFFGAAPVPLDTGETCVVGIWSRSVPPDQLRVFLELVAEELTFGASFVGYAARIRDQATVGRAFVQCAPFPIVVIDNQDRVVHWNPSSERLFGWTAANVLGRPTPFVVDSEAKQLSDYTTAVREHGVTRSVNLKARRADGTSLSLTVRGFRVHRSRQDAGEVVLLVSDLSDRERIERDLRMQAAVEQVINRADSVEDVALSLLDVVARRLGAVTGELWRLDDDSWSLTAEWPRPRSDQRRPHRQPKSGERAADGSVLDQLRNAHGPVCVRHAASRLNPRRRTATGAGVQLDAVGIPVRIRNRLAGAVLLSGIDVESVDGSLRSALMSVGLQISELIVREQMLHALRESEQQLHQGNKMQSLGQLAGGIAHDFNNLLTVMLVNSELAGEMLEEASPVHKLLSDIHLAADRAASLTRQLLTFSRKDAVVAQTIQTNQKLEEASGLLNRLLTSTVSMTLDLDPRVHHVRIDPTQFEQVILNLVVNARDAMPDGGEIVVRTRNVEMSAASLRTHPESRPGPYVALSVSDTGCGMDEETIRRVFEPFFTTKGPQRGTGMGLATVFGIVSRCGGFVDVQSRPGEGTTFTVFLPKCTLGIAPQQVDETTYAEGDLSGDETILLVEDEDVVRNLVERILQVRGYRVLAASDGEDALRFLDAHAADVDLLLTDVVLPGMNGLTLREQVGRRYPHIRSALMSGYPDVRPGSGNPSHSDAPPPLLIKPFTSLALARHVRTALDHRAVSG